MNSEKNDKGLAPRRLIQTNFYIDRSNRTRVQGCDVATCTPHFIPSVTFQHTP
jgi:hypothetical protein